MAVPSAVAEVPGGTRMRRLQTWSLLREPLPQVSAVSSVPHATWRIRAREPGAGDSQDCIRRVTVTADTATSSAICRLWSFFSFFPRPLPPRPYRRETSQWKPPILVCTGIRLYRCALFASRNEAVWNPPPLPLGWCDTQGPKSPPPGVPLSGSRRPVAGVTIQDASLESFSGHLKNSPAMRHRDRWATGWQHSTNSMIFLGWSLKDSG